MYKQDRKGLAPSLRQKMQIWDHVEDMEPRKGQLFFVARSSYRHGRKFCLSLT